MNGLDGQMFGFEEDWQRLGLSRERCDEGSLSLMAAKPRGAAQA
jgi:hypothetical protein